MHVIECVSDTGVDEVPNLNALIATTCNQMATSRMEVDRADPVLVSFTCHDILLVLHVPNLPGAIITGGCNYLLLGMQCHTTNAFWIALAVRINLLVHRHALYHVLKSL